MSEIIAVAQIVKDARRALEPVLKPLEADVRSELGMGEMAKLSTMLVTYNLDKTLSTESAAKNYIAMQNILLGAAQRATKLPDLASVLPASAKDARVAPVLQQLGASALLAVLQKPAAGFAAPAAVSFED